MAASKQARTLTHFCIAILLVWGSLRLAPTNIYMCSHQTCYMYFLQYKLMAIIYHCLDYRNIQQLMK